MATPPVHDTPTTRPPQAPTGSYPLSGIPEYLAVGLKPRDIMTKHAFENAVRLVMVTGGSTNATFHPIAMARRKPFLMNN